MNAALLALAAQQAQASKAITKQLSEAGASSSRAATRVDLSAKGSDKVLQQLLRQGHVRDAGSGRFWLDEEGIARSRANGVRLALIATLFLLSLCASLLALALAG